MFAAIDWSNLELSGVFIAGMIVGGIAVIRITRMVMEWLRNERKKDE